jgi:hypothetical protein
MKYILLVHPSQEDFDRPKDPADLAAGYAYGQALQAQASSSPAGAFPIWMLHWNGLLGIQLSLNTRLRCVR